MKKRSAPTSSSSAARGTKVIAHTDAISPAEAPAQASIDQQLQNGGLHCGRIWKSPRDKSRCIEATIREYNGSAYCDLRLFELNERGQMLPTKKGITVSVRQLGAFAKLVGDAYRRAAQAGITPRSS